MDASNKQAEQLKDFLGGGQWVRRRPKKNVWANLAVVVAATGLAIVMGEGLIRILRPRTIESLRTVSENGVPVHEVEFSGLAWDDESWRSVRIETNALGYSGPFGMGTVSGEEERIVVLGDSFAEGYQVDVDKTFPALLQAGLESPESSVAVWNFGFAGTGPVEAWMIYHEYVRTVVDPDIVVLAVALNDHVDANKYRSQRDVLRTGDPSRIEFAKAPRPGWRRTIARHSRLAELLVLRVNRSPRIRRLFQSLGLMRDRVDGTISGVPEHLAQFQVGYQLTEHYQMWFAAFDRLAEDLARDSTDLVVVLIPLKIQMPPRDAKDAAASRLPTNDGSSVDFDRVGVFLEKAMRDRGIEFFDLTPVFRARSPETELYFVGHFNESGHALTATALATYLCERSPVDPEHGVDRTHDAPSADNIC